MEVESAAVAAAAATTASQVPVGTKRLFSNSTPPTSQNDQGGINAQRRLRFSRIKSVITDSIKALADAKSFIEVVKMHSSTGVVKFVEDVLGAHSEDNEIKLNRLNEQIVTCTNYVVGIAHDLSHRQCWLSNTSKKRCSYDAQTENFMHAVDQWRHLCAAYDCAFTWMDSSDPFASKMSSLTATMERVTTNCVFITALITANTSTSLSSSSLRTSVRTRQCTSNIDAILYKFDLIKKTTKKLIVEFNCMTDKYSQFTELLGQVETQIIRSRHYLKTIIQANLKRISSQVAAKTGCSKSWCNQPLADRVLDELCTNGSRMSLFETYSNHRRHVAIEPARKYIKMLFDQEYDLASNAWGFTFIAEDDDNRDKIASYAEACNSGVYGDIFPVQCVVIPLVDRVLWVITRHSRGTGIGAEAWLATPEACKQSILDMHADDTPSEPIPVMRDSAARALALRRNADFKNLIGTNQLTCINVGGDSRVIVAGVLLKEWIGQNDDHLVLEEDSVESVSEEIVLPNMPTVPLTRRTLEACRDVTQRFVPSSQVRKWIPEDVIAPMARYFTRPCLASALAFLGSEEDGETFEMYDSFSASVMACDHVVGTTLATILLLSSIGDRVAELLPYDFPSAVLITSASGKYTFIDVFRLETACDPTGPTIGEEASRRGISIRAAVISALVNLIGAKRRAGFVLNYFDQLLCHVHSTGAFPGANCPDPYQACINLNNHCWNRFLHHNICYVPPDDIKDAFLPVISWCAAGELKQWRQMPASHLPRRTMVLSRDHFLVKHATVLEQDKTSRLISMRKFIMDFYNTILYCDDGNGRVSDTVFPIPPKGYVRLVVPENSSPFCAHLEAQETRVYGYGFDRSLVANFIRTANELTELITEPVFNNSVLLMAATVLVIYGRQIGVGEPLDRSVLPFAVSNRAIRALSLTTAKKALAHAEVVNVIYDSATCMWHSVDAFFGAILESEEDPCIDSDSHSARALEAVLDRHAGSVGYANLERILYMGFVETEIVFDISPTPHEERILAVLEKVIAHPSQKSIFLEFFSGSSTSTMRQIKCMISLRTTNSSYDHLPAAASCTQTIFMPNYWELCSSETSAEEVDAHALARTLYAMKISEGRFTEP